MYHTSLSFVSCGFTDNLYRCFISTQKVIRLSQYLTWGKWMTGFVKGLWYSKSKQKKLKCGARYHHPRRQQCVLSRNMRMFKVATWHYRSNHHLKKVYLTWFAMLLIIPQLNLYFQFNNHPIWPPNVASGDLGNWNWNRILVVVAT